MSDRHEGGCHCGAVRFTLEHEAVLRQGICHCRDCQRTSGAPMVAWLLAEAAGLSVAGEVAEYRSSEHARWQHCPNCGSGLFYYNEDVFPGRVDVQAATFDDPDALPEPGTRVQLADAPGWTRHYADIPGFDRFP